MTEPLVSVVIPAYNASRYIREAVESALRQTYSHLEVIVVDDGSTDRVDWVAQLDPQRVVYVWQPNGGPGSARNAGIRLARGTYVAFLDADDVWEPDKLERQFAALARRPEAALVYGAMRRMDASGCLLEERPRAVPRPSGRIEVSLFWKNTIPLSTVLLRRDCAEAVGLFSDDPDLFGVEDYDLWLRVAERYECLGLDEPLARYRLHLGGISRRTAHAYNAEQRVIEQTAARRGGMDAAKLQRRLARLRFECGHEFWTLGQWAAAREQLWISLRHHPGNARAWFYLIAASFGQPGASAARAVKQRLMSAGGAAVPGGNGRLRLLHVLNTLDTGGAEHVVLNLATRLDPARYALHVCSFSGEGQLADRFRRLGATVHALRRRPGIDGGLVGYLAGLIRREHIQLIHTHNVAPWLYGALAARWTRTRLCHTEHSNVFPHQRLLQAAERWLARWTEVLISDSEKVTRQLIAQGIPADRITTVPNGIDTARFAAPVDRAEVRRRLGLDPGAPVVGTVGRLAAIKDQVTLLEAFALVWSAYPEAWLLLVGEGPMRPELEARAMILGIAGRVQFLGDRSDVPELLGAMDVFALSSVSEGLPLTVLEAMAAGLPVVSTRVGGVPEAVVDGETGLLTPPKDPRALADALIGLLADPMERRRLGAAGRTRARERFDLGRMVDAYEAAYCDEPISQRG